MIYAKKIHENADAFLICFGIFWLSAKCFFSVKAQTIFIVNLLRQNHQVSSEPAQAKRAQKISFRSGVT
jgi:hypothetical protein